MPRRRSVTTLASVQRDHSQFDSDFNMIYDSLLNSLENGAVSESNNLVPLIMACIRVVERLSVDKGPGKKALVMALMTRLIADSEMSEQNKISVQVVLESLGPSIIDGLIDADHGRLLAKGWAKVREKCGC
jgi:hypothetical protein|uniref:Uncharacterized protein n=1 Tax=viral metagenome TaxID=1070528 RepID=A0A6C0IV14_9ZZZZ